MNQVYEAGATQENFMTDAATGFAAAVLVEVLTRWPTLILEGAW